MWESISHTLSNPEFWQFASIPFISALVGWITNVLALKMTFYPLEFAGVWKLGWQGIIPAKAGKMAGKSVDLLTKICELKIVLSRSSLKESLKRWNRRLPGLHRTNH
ncbi:MAG: hypothetical protein R3B93_28515 [Bacteroidia bacterium]